MFDLEAAGYRNPVLIAATDGVGTKLAVATAAGQHENIGVDLVAMCVNDLVVHGAEPLFFLDYFATGKLESVVAEEVLRGIAAGCREARCALLGGETAEMPSLYDAGQYDLAGFAVGAVERDSLLTGAEVKAGDCILGLNSNGLHANGFSLVRNLIEDAGLDYGAAAQFSPQQTLGETLLQPTRIYVSACLQALHRGKVKALVHITGGGLIENIPRVLPDGLTAEIDCDSWNIPPVFPWLAELGPVEGREMVRTFNCGIGMAAMTASQDAPAVEATFTTAGETVTRIGRVVPRRSGAAAVELEGLTPTWPR